MFVDTIELIIPIRQDNIKDWTRFRRAGTGSYLLSSADIENEKQKPFTRLTLNPTRTIRQRGVHLPLINLIRRNGYWFVQPDGSLPRFYFGTNLYECDKNDLEPVVQKYYDFLCDNGLFVSKDAIYQAEVRKVDISKIFLVRPDIPPHTLLEVFRRIDYDVRHEIHDIDYYDNEKRDIREGGKGYGITWGTKKKKIASFYLKYEQISSQDTPTLIEKELMQFVPANEGRIYLAWKLEECLFEKTRVTKRLNKLSGRNQKVYTFTDLWDKDLMQAVLLDRGTKLFKGADLNTLLLGSLKPREISDHLRKAHPTIQTTRIATISHWARFASDEGHKEMKKWLVKEYSKATRSRIQRESRELTENMKGLPMQEVYDDFFRQLTELKPIRSKEDLLIKSKPIDNLQNTIIKKKSDITKDGDGECLMLFPEFRKM